jgi:hypothetical protein
MSHARTTIKGTATALLAHEAPRTMFRLGFAAIALAGCLIVATGDARARLATPDEERAYCTELYGVYFRYHLNLFHHDGDAERADMARYDCQRGNLEAGTKQLERILRNDGFVIPSERSPTSLNNFSRQAD